MGPRAANHQQSQATQSDSLYYEGIWLTLLRKTHSMPAGGQLLNTSCPLTSLREPSYFWDLPWKSGFGQLHHVCLLLVVLVPPPRHITLWDDSPINLSWQLAWSRLFQYRSFRRPGRFVPVPGLGSWRMTTLSACEQDSPPALHARPRAVMILPQAIATFSTSV